jgi:hypothetical protein
MAKIAYRVEVKFETDADRPEEASRILGELREFGTVTIKAAHAARKEESK